MKTSSNEIQATVSADPDSAKASGLALLFRAPSPGPGEDGGIADLMRSERRNFCARNDHDAGYKAGLVVLSTWLNDREWVECEPARSSTRDVLAKVARLPGSHLLAKEIGPVLPVAYVGEVIRAVLLVADAPSPVVANITGFASALLRSEKQVRLEPSYAISDVLLHSALRAHLHRPEDGLCTSRDMPELGYILQQCVLTDAQREMVARECLQSLARFHEEEDLDSVGMIFDSVAVNLTRDELSAFVSTVWSATPAGLGDEVGLLVFGMTRTAARLRSGG